MAQLDDQAAVVADEQIDGAAEQTNASADEQGSDIDALYPPDPENGDGDAGEGDQGGDAEGGDESANDDLPPINAPHSWKAEEKELFAQLPRDAQETIARRESERDKFVQTKAREAEQAKTQVLSQARQELAEIHSRKAQEYQQLAARFMPQPPDPQLLWGSPEDQVAYQRQQALYSQAQAQQQQLLQRAQAEQEEAQQLAQDNERQAAVQELETLYGNFPDWFEEGTLNLKRDTISRLQPIGEALGYPRELMAQARAVDFVALNVAADWKAKADRWDKLQKDKMAGVRAAKQLPKVARPGAGGGAQPQTDDALALLYPNEVKRRS